MLEMPKLKIKKNGKQGSKAEKPSPSLTLTLDYPQEKEVVSAGHYAVRLSADSSALVEISMDGDSWKLCRFSAGHFWFDWYPTKSGKVKINTRIKSHGGSWSEPQTRTVQVK